MINHVPAHELPSTINHSPRPPTQAAIYHGTFDPLTLGHLDVIERAARIFGRPVVAVAVNTTKNPGIRNPRWPIPAGDGAPSLMPLLETALDDASWDAFSSGSANEPAGPDHLHALISNAAPRCPFTP